MGEKNQPIIQLKDASLKRNGRLLWQNLDLSISPGEFLAVLGPNGAGKTSLLNVILGLLPLNKGSIRIEGKLPRRGNPNMGYIPQQKSFDTTLPIRGRDLVQLGLNGHLFGFRGYDKANTAKVDKAISSLDASEFATLPIGLLSGGQQQRLRIAQALVSSPQLLLCDEPLLSLDLASQRTVTSLFNEYRKKNDAAVIFVTHDINPILPYVDRVLYIANGKWVADKPEAVLKAETLTKLYGTSVDIIRIKNKILVVSDEAEAIDNTMAHHGDIK